MERDLLKLGLLFKETGFIRDTAWNKYVEAMGITQKSMSEVLKQEVSVQAIKEFSEIGTKTIKDLLFTEISFPFGKKKKEEPGVVQQQAAPRVDNFINNHELYDFLDKNPRSIKSVISKLVSNEVIKKKDSEEWDAEAKKAKTTIGRYVVQTQCISPEMVTECIVTDSAFQKKCRYAMVKSLIVSNEILDAKTMDAAWKAADKEGLPVINELEKEKKYTEGELFNAIEDGLWFENFAYENFKLSEKDGKILPVRFMERNMVFAVKKARGQLVLAMVNPFDIKTIDTVAYLTDTVVTPILLNQNDFYDLLAKYAGKKSVTDIPKGIAAAKSEATAPAVSAAQQTTTSAATSPVAPAAAHEVDLLSVSESGSAVDVVTKVVEQALSSRATDVHFEAMEDCMRVRFRIDGNLHNIMDISKDIKESVLARIKILSSMDVTERRHPQDGHFSFKLEGRNYDMRIATVPTFWGEKLVMRIFSESTILKGFDDLGLEKDDLNKMKELIKHPNGMMLVTGPTGSGKTSTLYSALHTLNEEKRNIITIEDPVEYRIRGANQIQVDTSINLDFANCIRAVLRQDADVLMVGEIRDPDTAYIATRAALTGHLVLSTLHTNSSVGALTTLQYLGVEPFMIASSVIGVIAQRLVRQICVECAEEYKVEQGLLDDMKFSPTDAKKIKHGVGCEACLNTGYKGRTGVFEILSVSPRIKKMVVDGASEALIADVALEEGLKNLFLAGRKKVLQGVTTPEEVMNIVHI